MAFEFGVIDSLDPTISLGALIVVVLFIVFFEYSIGITEYLFEGSPMYNIMIKAIYKELMLMGFVSFTITMVEAANTNLSELMESWLEALDFAHILIFYMTIFFVLNAFQLMRTSVTTSSMYRQMYYEKTGDLVEEVQELEDKPWSRFFYNWQYLSSSLRDRVEFHVLHSLFRDTYLLPEAFDFPSYISGCFDRYALKTINHGIITWAVLIVLGLLNFARIVLGWSCTEADGIDAKDRERESEVLRRWLKEREGHDIEADICALQNTIMFLVAAVITCIYTIIVVFVTRTYQIRLLDRIGFTEPKDYLLFLKFVSEEDDKVRARESLTTNSSLKRAIEVEFDQNEFVEDEEGFRFLGDLLIHNINVVSDFFNEGYFAIRMRLNDTFWPRKQSEERKSYRNLLDVMGDEAPLLGDHHHHPYRSSSSTGVDMEAAMNKHINNNRSSSSMSISTADDNDNIDKKKKKKKAKGGKSRSFDGKITSSSSKPKKSSFSSPPPLPRSYYGSFSEAEAKVLSGRKRLDGGDVRLFSLLEKNPDNGSFISSSSSSGSGASGSGSVGSSSSINSSTDDDRDLDASNNSRGSAVHRRLSRGKAGHFQNFGVGEGYEDDFGYGDISSRPDSMDGADGLLAGGGGGIGEGSSGSVLASAPWRGVESYLSKSGDKAGTGAGRGLAMMAHTGMNRSSFTLGSPSGGGAAGERGGSRVVAAASSAVTSSSHHAAERGGGGGGGSSPCSRSRAGSDDPHQSNKSGNNGSSNKSSSSNNNNNNNSSSHHHKTGTGSANDLSAAAAAGEHQKGTGGGGGTRRNKLASLGMLRGSMHNVKASLSKTPHGSSSTGMGSGHTGKAPAATLSSGGGSGSTSSPPSGTSLAGKSGSPLVGATLESVSEVGIALSSLSEGENVGGVIAGGGGSSGGRGKELVQHSGSDDSALQLLPASVHHGQSAARAGLEGTGTDLALAKRPLPSPSPSRVSFSPTKVSSHTAAAAGAESTSATAATSGAIGTDSPSFSGSPMPAPSPFPSSPAGAAAAASAAAVQQKEKSKSLRESLRRASKKIQALKKLGTLEKVAYADSEHLPPPPTSLSSSSSAAFSPSPGSRGGAEKRGSGSLDNSTHSAASGRGGRRPATTSTTTSTTTATAAASLFRSVTPQAEYGSLQADPSTGMGMGMGINNPGDGISSSINSGNGRPGVSSLLSTKLRGGDDSWLEPGTSLGNVGASADDMDFDDYEDDQSRARTGKQQQHQHQYQGEGEGERKGGAKEEEEEEMDASAYSLIESFQAYKEALEREERIEKMAREALRGITHTVNKDINNEISIDINLSKKKRPSAFGPPLREKSGNSESSGPGSAAYSAAYAAAAAAVDAAPQTTTTGAPNRSLSRSHSAHYTQHDLEDATAMQEKEHDIEEEFHTIYLFNRPDLFHQAVELCIMFNCLYLALWATNFAVMVSDESIPEAYHVTLHILMLLPVLIVVPCMGIIAKTCALMNALTELNLEVVYDVLRETEEIEVLVVELREKLLSRLDSVSNVFDHKTTIKMLFQEIDQDGSGSIDKTEFRNLLRKLKLTYSQERFKLLFRAVDSINGDGSIEEDELLDFLFPDGSDSV